MHHVIYILLLAQQTEDDLLQDEGCGGEMTQP